MPTQTYTVIDLESQLRDDADGAARDEIIRELNNSSTALKQQLDGGLSPEAFAKLTRVKRAVDMSAAVVGNCWKLAHPAG